MPGTLKPGGRAVLLYPQACDCFFFYRRRLQDLLALRAFGVTVLKGSWGVVTRVITKVTILIITYNPF